MRYLWHLRRPDSDYASVCEVVVAAEREVEARVFAQLAGGVPDGAWHVPTVKVAKIGVAARGMNGVLVKAVHRG
jgi:hypothetical protein